MPHNLTLVTPTYVGDLERFALLRRSAERWAVEVPHFAIVNDEDVDLFRRRFAGDRHLEIVPITALLPSVGRIRTAALGLHLRGVMARLGVRVTEGWFLQQIAKLEAYRIAGDGYMAMDSDAFFVRPFDPETFWDAEGRLMLLETPCEWLEMQEWYCHSMRFLLQPVYAERSRMHVDSAVPMHSATVKRMLDYIEATHKGPWWSAMLRHSVMEFSTYGAFARHVDGLRDVYVSDTEFVRHVWALTNGLDSLADDLREKTEEPFVVISGIASTNKEDPADYIHLVEARWDEIERSLSPTG